MGNIMAWFMAGVMTICSGGMSVVNVDMAEVITDSKISAELLEKMETGETEYSVMVWLKDIDYETVNKEVEAITHHSWSEIELAENAVYTEQAERMTQNAGMQSVGNEMQMAFDGQTISELSVIQMQVDEMITTERQIASEAYMRQNISVVDDYGLQMDVEYVSRYAPMFIANLSEEQIFKLCKSEKITQIGYWQNGMDVWDDTEVQTLTTTVSTPDTTYLSYICADTLQNMGLKGTGVKIGLLDGREVGKESHAELNNSNIIPLGKYMESETEHSILMARIICGKYGVAPRATVYSYGTIHKYKNIEAIELLIDNGVTVINYSKGNARKDNDYTDYEKWLDHIAAQHGVTFVVASGNISSTGTDICEPALAYNVITVAAANSQEDDLYKNSAYIFNAGCHKPDIAAPGVNVLEDISGTSQAAACVTGMIALMMQAKPSLAKSPHIIKAIVIASCDHIAGSSSFGTGYEARQGAGVVNAVRAIEIIQKGQYYGNYLAEDRSFTININIETSCAVHSYVLVGIKMNIGTGSHEKDEYNNQDMPSSQLAVLSSAGGITGYCARANTSVQLVRSSSSYASAMIGIGFSNVGSRGVPYAIAWY